MIDAVTIRPAQTRDAVACAAIPNDWIDDADWMPRVHSHSGVTDDYRDFVFAKRAVFVSCDPPLGFIALDTENAFVTELDFAQPGHGTGRSLLDHAKFRSRKLDLWTFVANNYARRFYEGEGFTEVSQIDRNNKEGLPDVLYPRGCDV